MNTEVPSTSATYVAGSAFAIRIRSHEIVVDQTIAGGGADSAPTPLELLSASLAGCIAYYVHCFLRARELPADGLRVNVSETRAQNPARIDRFSVDVRLPNGVPERYLPMLERVIDTCPAHNTLSLGTDIDVSFTTAAEAFAQVE
jgi:uncharacterized OsmC-like protein